MNSINKYSGVLAGIAIVIAIVAISFSSHVKTVQISVPVKEGAVLNSNGLYTSYNAMQLTDSTNQNLYNATDTVSYQRQAFNYTQNNGTTTPCAIQSPAATTTIQMISFMETTATSTTAKVTFATSTTAFATSSSIFSQGNFGAATSSNASAITWDAGSNNSVISPSQWVVVGLQNDAAAGGWVIGGVCTATFQGIN